jgi:hypothetical protein
MNCETALAAACTHVANTLATRFLRRTSTAKTLEIAFDSKALRETCEIEASAEAQIGKAAARALKHRLADLFAVASPQELLAGRPRVLQDQDVMSVELSDGYRLIFEPNHLNNPMTAEMRTEWTRVNRIKLLRIER